MFHLYIVTLYHTNTNSMHGENIKAFRNFSFPSTILLSYHHSECRLLSKLSLRLNLLSIWLPLFFCTHFFLYLTINFLSRNLPRVPITNYSRLVWLTYPNWLSFQYWMFKPAIWIYNYLHLILIQTWPDTAKHRESLYIRKTLTLKY